MSGFVQIATSAGTRETAQRIAVELVSRRLAACVQVSGPVLSTFRWQGAVETVEEWVCTAKTVQSHVDAVEKLVKELHSYEVPELVVTPIVGGSKAYLHWLEGQVD